MNIIMLIDKIITAVSTDTALIAWCNSNFTKVHTIYKGIDLRKPPAQTECPVISLALINKNPDETKDIVPHGIGAVCEIYDNTSPTSTVTKDGVTIKEYPGIDKIEGFRKAVESAITTIDFDSDNDLVGLRCAEIKVDYDTINVFPFFRAFMEISFTNILSQGDDTWT